MKLHEAMLNVLRHAARSLTAREIAEAIEQRALYLREDGTPATPSQIRARARKYPHLFKTEGRPLSFSRAVPGEEDDKSSSRTAALQRLKKDQLEVAHYFLNVSATVSGFDRLMEIIGSFRVAAGQWSAEEAEKELEGVKLQEAAHEYDRLTWELILCRSVDGFLAYVSDVLALVFQNRPETMKSAEMIRLDLILENDTMDELIGVLADKRVNDLAYKGMRELSSHLSDRLGLQLFGSQKDLERAADIVEIRNLIVHNRGTINSTFLKKMSKPLGKLGEQVKIEEDALYDDLWFLVASASLIDEAAVEKFNLPRGKIGA